MALPQAMQRSNSITETVTREHDDRVFRSVIENPLVSPIVASLNAITEMLRHERELFTGGEDICLTR